MTSTVAPKKQMKYVRLGKSGLKVSKIILGCMSYGDPKWTPMGNWILGEEEGFEHIKAAYDAGIQTFDTAGCYSNGYSEIVLGKAIKHFNLPRDEIVIMTKCYFAVGRTPGESFILGGADENGYVNQHGLSRKNIFGSVKESLKRLQLDYIDVLQCHRFDVNTPIEETMQALHDVVQAGYVRYIGMSSCYAWQFAMMQNYAINNKLTPFISMQNHYNLVYREEEREMMPLLKHLGVGSIPWSPLARGLVTRPFNQASNTARGSSDWMPYMDEANVKNTGEIVNRLEEFSKTKGIPMSQLALAWVMNKDPVAAPIVGSTNLKNIEDLLGALNVTLTDEEMAHLEEPYKAMPIVGH